MSSKGGEACTVLIRHEQDVVSARQAGRELATKLGFGSAKQTRLATAISELARNVLQYAGLGVCSLEDTSNGEEARLKVLIEDTGPGIVDLEAALRDGFSTGGGLGAGLPGARRLVDEFHIKSEPGYTGITLSLVRRRTR